MKIILYFVFSTILILVNHTVLAEQSQHCTNRSSGSEKRCLTGTKEDKGTNSKSYVLQLLQSLAEQRAIPSITPLLQDSEPYVRDAAIEVLGQLGAKEAIPSIIPLLQDKDRNVRVRAMEALVQLEAKEAIPAIIPLLKDNESTVRMAAI